MKIDIQIVTKNHGGILNNPFEFKREGDKRLDTIFRLVCPGVILEQLKIEKRAIKDDRNYGPTVREIISSERQAKLTPKQQDFIVKNLDKKLFFILHNHTSLLLNADKNIRDAATTANPLPIRILSTTDLLKTKSNDAIDDVYVDILSLKNSTDKVLWERTSEKDKNVLSMQDKKALIEEFGEEDAKWLCSEEGQLLFFALLEAMNLKLCEKELKTINLIKKSFNKSLGNPDKKAVNTFARIQSSSVAMIQECDEAFFKQVNSAKSLWKRFLGISNKYFDVSDQKHEGSSTCVLLKQKDFAPPTEAESRPRVIDFIDTYGKLVPHRYNEGKVNGVIAKHKKTGSLVFAVSCHAKENRYDEKTKQLVGTNDASLQLNAIITEWNKLQKEFGCAVELLIGGDFNTKKPEDLKILKEFSASNNLYITDTGATSKKQRAVTVQQKKAGVEIEVIEDFVISSSPLILEKTTPPSHVKGECLPSLTNYSDHTEVITAIALETITQ